MIQEIQGQDPLVMASDDMAVDICIFAMTVEVIKIRYKPKNL